MADFSNNIFFTIFFTFTNFNELVTIVFGCDFLFGKINSKKMKIFLVIFQLSFSLEIFDQNFEFAENFRF